MNSRWENAKSVFGGVNLGLFGTAIAMAQWCTKFFGVIGNYVFGVAAVTSWAEAIIEGRLAYNTLRPKAPDYQALDNRQGREKTKTEKAAVLGSAVFALLKAIAVTAATVLAFIGFVHLAPPILILTLGVVGVGGYLGASLYHGVKGMIGGVKALINYYRSRNAEIDGTRERIKDEDMDEDMYEDMVRISPETEGILLETDDQYRKHFKLAGEYLLKGLLITTIAAGIGVAFSAGPGFAAVGGFMLTVAAKIGITAIAAWIYSAGATIGATVAALPSAWVVGTAVAALTADLAVRIVPILKPRCVEQFRQFKEYLIDDSRSKKVQRQEKRESKNQQQALRSLVSVVVEQLHIPKDTDLNELTNHLRRGLFSVTMSGSDGVILFPSRSRDRKEYNTNSNDINDIEEVQEVRATTVYR